MKEGGMSFCVVEGGLFLYAGYNGALSCCGRQWILRSISRSIGPLPDARNQKWPQQRKCKKCRSY